MFSPENCAVPSDVVTDELKTNIAAILICLQEMTDGRLGYGGEVDRLDPPVSDQRVNMKWLFLMTTKMLMPSDTVCT